MNTVVWYAPWMDDPIQLSLGLYHQFMREVKERTAAIERMIDRIKPGRPTIDAGYVEAESCILQVRYCCELIALASLAAHHQLGVGAKLLKSWNAEDTFARLSHLNPHCFPRAARITRPSGGIHIELLRDQMTRDELQAIYAACGELLHRGVLKHALAGGGRNYQLDDVVRWTSRIRGLLRHHVVMLLEPGNVFLVRMHNERGEVEVLYAQAPGPSILVQAPD